MRLANGVDGPEAIARLRDPIAAIANVVAEPAPRSRSSPSRWKARSSPVRPYRHNDHYWQVHFDTGKAIVATFAAAGYPLPETPIAPRERFAPMGGRPGAAEPLAMQARIQSLWRYPVKSRSGESLKTLVLDALTAARWATGAGPSSTPPPSCGGWAACRLDLVQARRGGRGRPAPAGRDGRTHARSTRWPQRHHPRLGRHLVRQWNSF